MQKISFFVVLFVMCVMSAVMVVMAHAPEDKIPGIIDIESSNVNSVLDGSKATLVEFYAPWCGHCKNLAPEMAKVGETLDKQKPAEVQVAKINCDAESSICQKYEVRGYPTIKYFPKGSDKPEEYNKGRTQEDIISFLNDKARAGLRVEKPLTHVVDLDNSNFDSIVSGADADVLVEFYAPWCGHCKQLAPVYEKVAKAFRLEKKCIVAKVDADAHRDLGSKFGVSGFPTIKFFPKGSKNPIDYDKGRGMEDFVEYLNEKCGTKRTDSGLLNDEAGKSAALDALAKQFASASKDQQASLISKAEADKAGNPYYGKVMKSIADKGVEYVSKETARLQRILDGGNVNDEMLDSLKIRLNVLGSFKQ